MAKLTEIQRVMGGDKEDKKERKKRSKGVEDIAGAAV